MKKIALGLILGLFLSFAGPALAAQIFNLTPVSYPVYVNGQAYEDKINPLLNYGGKTYLPLAKIADLLGTKYTWNESQFKLDIAPKALVTPPAEWTVDQLKVAAKANKLIVTLGKSGSEATTYAFQKKDGLWTQFLISEGFVGRNGISASKHEGDGETPAGIYGLSKPFGVAEDPGSKTPYTKLTANDFWVDDANSKYYNTWAKGDVADKDWNSAEDLSKETLAYKYAMVIDYNTDKIVKGDGSAIFLHCSTNRATAGCVSVPEEDMVKLLGFIDADTQIVIAQSVKDLLKY